MKYHSVFKSISGEIGGFKQGEFVTFLRLWGCNLSCPYCDASQTQDKRFCGDIKPADMVHEHLKGVSKLVITGGEPLLQQAELIQLIETLSFEANVGATPKIQIETNGTITPREELYSLVNYWVFDYKLGCKNIFDFGVNLDAFNVSGNEVYLKFVISDYDDFKVCIPIIERLNKQYPSIIFAMSAITPSPWINQIDLFNWLMELPKELNVIMNTQLHKLIDMSGYLIL